MGDAVRLQYDPDLPPEIVAQLVEELELEPADLYPGEGFTAFTDLVQLYSAVDLPRLKDRPLTPSSGGGLRARGRLERDPQGDVLVYHPYQSFDAVTRFVEEAATDPSLGDQDDALPGQPDLADREGAGPRGRSGQGSPVLVELQARFDEEANIRWARALEEVGAHVVYGLVGYKTHCKVCLVVRQEADGIRRYCHLATGNYNAGTGGFYRTLACSPAARTFGEDLTEIFNLLTGLHAAAAISIICCVRRPGLREHFLAQNPPRGGPCRGRAPGAHHREGQQPGRSGRDRGALRGEPSRRRRSTS